jgi:hypothetical protein
LIAYFSSTAAPLHLLPLVADKQPFSADAVLLDEIADGVGSAGSGLLPTSVACFEF